MAILYHRPVPVRVDAHNQPRSFFWELDRGAYRGGGSTLAERRSQKTLRESGTGHRSSSPGHTPVPATVSAAERRIVAIHRTWRVRWNWWAEETHRAYYRVETAGGGIYDLYQELAAGQDGRWYLERVWD